MTMLCNLDLADPMDTTVVDDEMLIGVPPTISLGLPLLIPLLLCMSQDRV